VMTSKVVVGERVEYEYTHSSESRDTCWVRE